MRSLVIGASGGIGAALVAALEAPGDDGVGLSPGGDGVGLSPGGDVIGLSRSRDGLDLTDEESVARHLGALSGPFDLILVATGALGQPEKTIRALDPAAMAAQFALNATGPMLVLKHALRLMPRDRRAVFAALSARVGSIGDNRLGGWYSYRAAKAALNQLLHGAAIEVARSHPHAVIVALHPGTVATRFTEGYGADKQTPDQAAARLLAVIDGLGPAQSGGFFDHRGAPVPW